ncbi:MAG TPA: metallophosphoesterase [Dissulfurispiraceae bacterium]|nr:metallophosphoesterase [Dissulfurispiraceae bacterium]
MRVRRILIITLSLLLALLLAPCISSAAEHAYYHIVVLGDPHLPGETLAQKEQVRATINNWNDIDLVVAVGDICEEVGDDAEYAKAKAYFGAFTKPLALIGGNHDYIYEDSLSKTGKKVKARESTRGYKLDHFKKTFGLPQVYYTKSLGRYLMVFLTPDDLQASALTTISTAQYKWFETILAANREKPTIVFFHGPLSGTLDNYSKNANTDDYVAQPREEIRRILADNPQVFLWVSGHTHTSPKEPSFASAVNLYEGRVMNIHNSDMKRQHIYTNSLFLYNDRVIVKTFDHEKGTWMPALERTVTAWHTTVKE